MEKPSKSSERLGELVNILNCHENEMIKLYGWKLNSSDDQFEMK